MSVFASGLNQPSGISIDSSNNIYVVDKNNGLVRKITPDNVMTTILSGLYSPRGVCVDSNGNVIVSDSGNNAVRKISSDGTIVSIGSGFLGPTCVAVDLLSNNIYVCESSTIKRVTPLGVISTIASGVSPMGICVDANGNIFIADSFRDNPYAAPRSVIKKIASGSSTVTTLVTINGDHNENGITTDSDGSIYVLSTNSNANFVYKYFSSGVLVDSILVNGPIGIANTATIAPSGLAIDSSGHLLVSDTGKNCVKKLTSGTFSTFAFPFNLPRSVYLDSSNNIVFTDSGSNSIRRVSSNGLTVSTIASGLSNPMSSIVDSAGTIYVIESTTVLKKIAGSTVLTIGTWTLLQGMCFDADNNVIVLNGNSVMKVTVSDNSISTLASGMNSPRACALGSSGAIVVADTDNNAVKRINTDGTVDSIGSIGSIFSKPTGIAIDSSNNIFIADSGSRRILKIDSLGTTSTFASKLGVLNGIAVHPPSGSIITADSSYNVIRKISENFVGGQMIERTIGSIFTMDSLSNFFIAVPARNTVTKFTLSGAATTYVGFSNPQGLTVDSSNNVYVSNLGTKTIIKIAASDGTLSTYATDFNGPTSISMDGSNNLYVADKNNNNGFIVIKKISSSGVITTVLDNYISILNHLVADSAGNLYFSARLDFTSNGIHKRTTDGTVSNIASDFFSISSLSVDNSGNLYIANPDIIQLSSSGGRKTLSSSMAGSSGIVVDTSGNVFVANEGSNSIFKIEPPLLSISTLATLNCYANQGQCNFFNTPNVQELYSSPSGIDADSAGSLFVADTWNDRISKVDASTGTVSTYSTGFIRPRGVAVDAAGKVYVADTGNNAVKTIATDGTVNTLATGFNFPSGLCVDSSGTVYVADTNNNAVKRIATDGTVSSINSFVMWDGTFSTNFGSPQDVAIDSLGNVWVARVGTYGNGGIMKVKADGSSSAIVFDGSSSYSAVTLGPAGSVYGVTGDIVKKITSDGVVSNLATLPSSINSGMSGGIAVDPLGKIYASVFSTHQIQKITPPGPSSHGTFLTRIYCN